MTSFVDEQSSQASPRADQLTLQQLDEFCKSIGLTDNAIYDHLKKIKLGHWEKNGGKESQAYRVQKTFSKFKLNVGFSRFVKTVLYLKQSPDDFCWSNVSQAFGVPAELAEKFGEWMKVLWNENDFERILSASKDDKEKSETSTFLSRHQRCQTKRDAVLSRPVPSFMQALDQADYDSILMSMGLHPDVLKDESQDSYLSTVHTQHDRFKQILKNINASHCKKSTSDYYRFVNFFMLWLYKSQAEHWSAGYNLLITPSNALKFATLYMSGELRMTGTSPWIVDILNGNQSDYDLSPTNEECDELSSDTASKIISALTKFQEHQSVILGESCQSVGSDPLVRSFLKNQKADAPAKSRRRFLDRHRRVPLHMNIDKKAIESKTYLEIGTTLALRDRAHSMCSTWSVSRASESGRWEFCDLFPFKYDKSLPTVGSQDIDVLYCIQGRSKTRNDSQMEDWNMLVRHKDPVQCPLGSLALYVATRFYVDYDSFPKLWESKAEWYPEKIFPKATDSTSPIDPTTRYLKRKRHMEMCGTLGPKVLHDNRKFGTTVARLMEVDDVEISQLGFWETDVKSKVYAKIYRPSTAAKLSGFKDAQEYFIERAAFDPEDATDPDVIAFVRDVFWQIDDPDIIKKVQAKASGNSTTSDKAAMHVCDAFRLLRKILLQDLGYYYAHYPNLPIFESNLITKNISGFYKWLEWHSNACAAASEMSKDESIACSKATEIPSSAGDEALHLTTNALRNFCEVSEKTCSILSHFHTEMMHHFSAFKESLSERETMPVLHESSPVYIDPEDAVGPVIDEYPCQEKINEEGCENDKFLIKRLPTLSMYSLQAVYDEWTEAVVLDTARYPCLKVLDERRKHGDRSWDPKNNGLKTAIQRRRKIVTYIDKVALEKYGSVGKEAVRQAIKHIEEEMEALHGQQWTLNSLYLKINSYKYPRYQTRIKRNF